MVSKANMPNVEMTNNLIPSSVFLNSLASSFNGRSSCVHRQNAMPNAEDDAPADALNASEKPAFVDAVTQAVLLF